MGDLVLQVITSTDRRGAQVFATDLDVALQHRGWNVVTVALASGWEGGSLEVPVLGRRQLAPSTVRHLRSAVRRSAVVIAQGSTTLAAAALATAGTGIPFVYRSIGDPAYWASTALRRWRTAKFLRRAHSVAVVWPGGVDLIADVFGLPREKVRSIPNGVPATRFPLVDSQQRDAARRRLGIRPDRRSVVFLGSLTPEKRVGDAISAVGALPNVLLHIAGDGPERARLEAMAKAMAPGRVNFLGVTDDPRTLIAAADALVLPSSTEGLPAVLIEAGLSSVPVVASDVGGVREVVDDGTTGILFPAGDTEALATALARALVDRDRLSRGSRQRCLERFDIAVVASAWEDLLHDTIGATQLARSAS